ncbi:recombinase family protein [Pelagibius sp. Alg239-R121]|uniref:recombinase family protein n=1 Tax=Pelagibius sp. Alg239-R121 TaxID=2993448 RepID=UPI0024A673E1|nr:recombinase family protein [Pelagibius sp. Alg239-R121]
MKIGYARVSTHEQNLDLQLKALQEAGCDEVYSEKISSGRVIRPELEKALSRLREGDTLVVWKLDRLGRRTVELLDFIQDMERRGVAFQSLSDGIDPSSATGKAIFPIAGAFAELERNLIRERTLRGLEAAKAKGTKFGRKRKLGDKQVEMAVKLLETPHKDGSLPTYEEVAEVLGVNKSTISRRIAEYKERSA